MNLDEFKKLATLVRSDDRYDIYDLQIGDVTLSLTELHANKETKGHSHPNQEAYLFLGEAFVDIGDYPKVHFEAGDTLSFLPNLFHKVHAPYLTDTSLFSIFIGDRSKAIYTK